jgi:hypothetical protein
MRGCRNTAVRKVLAGIALAVLGLHFTGCAVPPTKRGGSGEGGHRVLDEARKMIGRRIIVQGGCWDYINAVYNNAGYPENMRRSVFKTEMDGPYADADQLQPGDWLYFVNLSYRGSQHSAIFVNWTNKITRRARMISYAGENRRTPARYMTYDLSKVYCIIRTQP